MINSEFLTFLSFLTINTENGRIEWEENSKDDSSFKATLPEGYIVSVSHVDIGGNARYIFMLARNEKIMNLNKMVSGSEEMENVAELFNILYTRQISKGLARLEADGEIITDNSEQECTPINSIWEKLPRIEQTQVTKE